MSSKVYQNDESETQLSLKPSRSGMTVLNENYVGKFRKLKVNSFYLQEIEKTLYESFISKIYIFLIFQSIDERIDEHISFNNKFNKTVVLEEGDIIVDSKVSTDGYKKLFFFY